MPSLSLNSPGVQINEIDESAIVTNNNGTTVFVAGFSNSGPTDEIIEVSSLPEFEQIFGTPTNAAERYFYYSVKPLFNTSGTIYTTRLPYGGGSGDGFGSQFSAVVYPVVAVSGNPVNFVTTAAITGTGGVVSKLTGAVDAYVLGKPLHFTLTKDQYLSCIDGGAINWSNTVTNTSGAALPIQSINDFGNAGVIVFNSAQTTVNDKYEGYYIGLLDNSDNNPATYYDGIITANTVNTAISNPGVVDSLTPIPNARLNFALSGTNTSSGTLSQALENAATFNIATNQYNDYVTLGLFKLRQSIFTPDTVKLDYILSESYVSSLDYYRQRTPTNGGPITSAYLGTVVNDISNNVKVLVNDNISSRLSSTWLNANGVPSKSVRVLSNELEGTLNNMSIFQQVSANIGINAGALAAAKTSFTNGYNGSVYGDSLMPLGAYSTPSPTNKVIGSIPLKVERALELVSNDELYDIDISVEGGLGTIYSVLCASQTATYDDTLTNASLQTALLALQTTVDYVAPNDSSLDLRGNYHTVFSLFSNFAQTMMNHIFIADPIRHILVTGSNTKTLSDPSKNWSQHVFSPLRHQFELANTSYAAAYANWARVNDGFSQTNVWVPFSGIVAADYVNSDTNYAYWAAPAGFKRGLVSVADDVAVAPNQKQRDDLYKFNLNPITQFVREGIVIYGQKTMQRMPSAFDRVNVRRLFILLEKQTKSIAKYYVFEPNSLYTRTRVVNDLTPLFESAKANTVNQGIYDYLIICSDTANNPPEVIDANELVIDVYIRAVRTSEFILVNFHATRTSTNFAEIQR